MAGLLEVCVESLASARAAISGGADTFLSKSKAHSLSAKLRRITKYIAIIFILAVIATNAISILGM